MPSVTKAKLEELVSASESYARTAMANQSRITETEAKLRTYDAVLEKVVRAAKGQSLSDERSSGSYLSGGMSYSEPWQGQPKPLDERLGDEIRQLNERIVTLESRLAAVVAVAQFAKAHKA